MDKPATIDAGASTLIFCEDGTPGITRRKVRHGWGYWDADGQRITDREEIDRLNRIALPPAYTDAWFSPVPHGHILATGIDARGRKQYRYHPDFRSHREGEKFDGCAGFGRLLPKVRKRVDKALRSHGLSRERAIASVVRLLDGGGIRIGNESYVKANNSFGATTLRKRHARFQGRELKLRFKAKSGQQRELRITDKSLIRFVRRMQDLPGQHLFRYVDDAGEACPVTSGDVNAFLRETMGQHFTAKHFRTFAASVHALELLATAEGKLPLKELLVAVSAKLGNTPAIARKSYVHPAVLALVPDQAAWRETLKLPRETAWLSRYERALIALLEGGPRTAELLAAPAGAAAGPSAA
ncbi:MAG: DNA topoisomerase IB [Novosphingobium sp.]